MTYVIVYFSSFALPETVEVSEDKNVFEFRKWRAPLQ